MEIIVEGWRFVPHSYSIVNQFQLLEMRQRSDLKLYHRDMPYLSASWQDKSLFDPVNDANLRTIPRPEIAQVADVTLRMYPPFNLTPSPSKITAVFGSVEWGIVTQNILRGMGVNSFAEAHSNDTLIITPSGWSKDGLVRSGAKSDQILVIPHGVDPDIYHPLPEDQRKIFRKNKGIDDYFIFFNVGLMCETRQGIHLLLKAFAQVVDKYPQARLILKGRDAIFPSANSINNVGQRNLTPAENAKIKPNLIYIGESLSFTELAQIYQIADVYVSPYFAEGFNLPVLEAIACGLPVICTAGGPTDDFTQPDFAWRIESQLHTIRGAENQVLFSLLPDEKHLLELMLNSIKFPHWREQARHTGPQFVNNHFTWTKIVDQMISKLRPLINSNYRPKLPLEIF